MKPGYAESTMTCFKKGKDRIHSDKTEEVCRAKGCSNQPFDKGLCNEHYSQLKRSIPVVMKRTTSNGIEMPIDEIYHNDYLFSMSDAMGVAYLHCYGSMPCYHKKCLSNGRVLFRCRYHPAASDYTKLFLAISDIVNNFVPPSLTEVNMASSKSHESTTDRRFCFIPACTKKHFESGLCLEHYKYLVEPLPNSKCGITHCNNKQYKNRLCKEHNALLEEMRK